ncbi:MAG: hypothetical protein ACJ8C4_07305 [Gemmataceae bacterium]
MTPNPGTRIATKQIQFDSRPYERFFDTAWANSQVSRLANTSLIQPFEELCLMWKSASNAHYMPLLFARNLSDFTNGFVNSFQPYSPQFFDALAQGLFDKMRDDLSATKKNKIRTFLEEVGKKIAEEEPLPEISVQSWWSQVSNHPEFR